MLGAARGLVYHHGSGNFTHVFSGVRVLREHRYVFLLSSFRAWYRAFLAEFAQGLGGANKRLLIAKSPRTTSVLSLSPINSHRKTFWSHDRKTLEVQQAQCSRAGAYHKIVGLPLVLPDCPEKHPDNLTTVCYQPVHREPPATRAWRTCL